MTRLVSFVYGTTTSYKIEFANLYMRIICNDAVITGLTTPYADADLPSLYIRQVGDVMWIVHSNYAPRKLIRTSATTFALTVIPFTKGPFLLRNDLVDPNETNSAYMKYIGTTTIGSSGTLLCCKSDGTTGVNFFDALHVGALFKLTTKRTATVSSGSNTGGSYTTICAAIAVKGTYTFTTMNFIAGTNEGTIILERSENGSDWETIRIETTSIIYSAVEEADNVQYRARVMTVAEGGLTSLGTIKASITVTNPTIDGIVKVTDFTDATIVDVEVIAALDATSGTAVTKRWAEGAWSNYRTWPSAVTFFEERCIYGGQSTVQEQVVYT